MDFKILKDDNITFTRQIVVMDSMGNTTVVADLKARLLANGIEANTEYFFRIIRGDIVKSNYDDVIEQVNLFKEEVKNKCKALGLIYI